jgi:acyl carrier protein
MVPISRTRIRDESPVWHPHSQIQIQDKCGGSAPRISSETDLLAPHKLATDNATVFDRFPMLGGFQMSRDEIRKVLLEFLDTISADDMAGLGIDDDVPFEESGFIDSLSMLEIVSFLETQFSIDFSHTGIDADNVGSVTKILDLVERSTA